MADVTDIELSLASLRPLQMDTWVGARAGWKLELYSDGLPPLGGWPWGQLHNTKAESGCAFPSTLWSPLNTTAAAEGTWDSMASLWPQATRNTYFIYHSGKSTLD